MNPLKILAATVTALLMLVTLTFPGVAEERVHAKPGSYWNYAVMDEIKQTKSVTESTLTEVKGEERVIRFVIRGTSNSSISVFDPNWNLLETSTGWKYSPHLGNGVPVPSDVGSQSKIDLSASRLQQGEWSDPTPATGEVKIVAVETIPTKAGKFETYRIETSNVFTWTTDIENKTVIGSRPRLTTGSGGHSSSAQVAGWG